MISDDDDFMQPHSMFLFANLFGGRQCRHEFSQMFHWDKEDRDYSLFDMIDDDDDDDDDDDYGINFARDAAATAKSKPKVKGPPKTSRNDGKSKKFFKIQLIEYR